MKRAQAYEEYSKEIQKPKGQVDYLKCAVLIAQQQYPDLDYQACEQQLMQIVDKVALSLPEARYPMRVLQTINKVMYQDMGFQGNTFDYYQPDNSYINMVLHRRTGALVVQPQRVSCAGPCRMPWCFVTCRLGHNVCK